MRKKHLAYLALALGVAMIYSLSELTSGKLDASTTLGKLQAQLANLALTGSQAGGAAAGSTAATTPWLAYGLVGVGAWLLFGRKVVAAV